jgi:signal transduction histidine kinase
MLNICPAIQPDKATGVETNVDLKERLGIEFLFMSHLQGHVIKLLIFFLLIIPIALNAEEIKPVNLSPTLERGIVTNLANNWKYKVGDHPEWANPDFDASSWKTFSDPNLYNKEVQKRINETNIIWFRKSLIIDSITTQNIVAYITQNGASEIYLDGKLIYSLGKVSSNPDSIVCVNQSSTPFAFPMKTGKEQVLAVRFAITKKKLPKFSGNAGFCSISVQREDFANEPLLIARSSLFDSNGILNLAFRNGWRFQPGDDLNRANPDFDDSDWKFFRPSGLTEPIPDSLWNGYGWFRYRFEMDSSAYALTTHLYFSTFGAAEVYLDGKLVQKFGNFSTNLQGEKRYMPYYKIFPSVVLQRGGSHVLAVRFSYHKGPGYKELLGKYAGTFGFDIGLATDRQNQYLISVARKEMLDACIPGTMLFLIVLLHGFLFLLFPDERSNLYIAIVATLLLLHILVNYSALFFELDVLQVALFSFPYVPLFMAALSMFPFTINSMFHQKPRLVHKVLIGLFPVFALANFIVSGFSVNMFIASVYISVILVFSSLVLIKAWKNKQKGVWYVAGGVLILIISAGTYLYYSKFSQNYNEVIGVTLGYMVYVSFPIGLTAFMASRFRDLYTHLEQKVNERTRELNQSLDELRSTQKQLIQSEKMASLGELTAGIAHEIQNPLNFVNNFSDVNKELLEELKEEAGKGNLEEVKSLANDVIGNEEKINHHGKRAESIVRGMLLHSRGSSGHKELVDINALCDEYLRLSYHGFRAKDKSFNADFKLEADQSLPKIEVVPQDIGRVLLNLINNAFYAVSERSKKGEPGYAPTVTVTAQLITSSQLQVAVKDNGSGIPDSIKDKIFQPFFTTKPTGQGTGLGLSLSYDIMKAHGGEIKVNTKSVHYDVAVKNEFMHRDQTGTEFTVILPA